MRHHGIRNDVTWFMMRKAAVEKDIQKGFDELGQMVCIIAKHPVLHKREAELIGEYIIDLKDTLFEFEMWLHDKGVFGK